MKKHIILVFSIMFFFISFILCWYSDQIFDSLFIFVIGIDIFMFIVFNILLVNSINNIYKNNNRTINILSLIILLINVIVIFLFPFRITKAKVDLNFYEKDRLKIIEQVKEGKLKSADSNIELPKKYKKHSTSGEIYLYQNNQDGVVIGFWIFRGMLSGSVELIYSTGGEELIRANETGHPIISVKEIKKNWYYVKTDY